MNHSLIKVDENNRKALFKNPNREAYSVSRIDGCLVTSGIRSDYLVSDSDAASVIVELKGVNVAHACEQQLASIKHPAVKPLLKRKIGFLVVCSRYPRFDTFVAKAKLKCMKEYGAGFHVVCNSGTFDINRVVEIDGPC